MRIYNFDIKKEVETMTKNGNAFKVPLADDPKTTIDLSWLNSTGNMETESSCNNTISAVTLPIGSIENSGINYGSCTANYDFMGYSSRLPEKMLENYFKNEMKEYSRQQEYTRKEAYDVRKEERKRQQKYEDEYAAGEIYARNDGSLDYILDISGKHIYGLKILNCNMYTATLYVCNFPRQNNILEIHIAMKNGKKTQFHVKESQDGFASKTFAKEMRKSGVIIAASKKKSSEIYRNLLEYSLRIAEIKKVFYSRGWWKTESGQWRFISENADVLREVENHV